ncbi:ATP-dependent protease [Prochlorococcus marinus str. MU1404]|uniref:LON peptidase substrate-binding domain-containing protein n=1 Tax=Prochlorococcus marinus TaxID=1219 RepID=UPI001AD9AABE|nr:LON peptidase substrate-binding domain-containing protein [Prochlorococcus marinus]MBO8230805.1 LON peptidase substrate-binding domain-containing protein [Prochlorococcus marinus XMU1404]MBW3073838.1 ATP-dependent protease [Prochlorococcus marinus str. MU1404]MCR8544863.1 LON peptidase substrate-binding domain-containing protein [Prochlorococcus marinus CUG1432]
MGELSVRELPLFPLPDVVLFPQEILPLHIFESRYRIMLQSVLETDSMFGVIKWDTTSKTMAKVGCCAQIIKHQTSEDGRSNLITMGQQRFQILEIIRSTPFYSAMVTWISDDHVENLQKLDSQKDLVKEALSDVINLTSKLTNTKKNLPDKLPNNPMELSFWIGAHLGGPVAEEQQRLLEERDTYTRLQREYEMLDHTRKQLAARTALKESFPDIKEN